MNVIILRNWSQKTAGVSVHIMYPSLWWEKLWKFFWYKFKDGCLQDKYVLPSEVQRTTIPPSPPTGPNIGNFMVKPLMHSLKTSQRMWSDQSNVRDGQKTNLVLSWCNALAGWISEHDWFLLLCGMFKHFITGSLM